MGKCRLCLSPGTNISTCPLNPESKNPNVEKHPLSSKRVKSPKRETKSSDKKMVYNYDLKRKVKIESKENKTFSKLLYKSQFDAYDYLPISDIKFILGVKTYKIYDLNGHKIHLAGEQHVGEQKFDPSETILFPMYINMVSNIMESKVPISVYAERDPTNKTDMYSYVEKHSTNTKIFRSDKRYELGIKNKHWYKLYKSLYYALGHEEFHFFDALKPSDYIFKKTPKQIIQEEIRDIDKYINANYKKFKHTKEYEKVNFHKRLNAATWMDKKFDYHSLKRETDALRSDKDSKLPHMYKAVKMLDPILDVYSPIMDIYIISELKKIAESKTVEPAVFIHVGDAHASLYSKILLEMNAEEIYDGDIGKARLVKFPPLKYLKDSY